jgi:hypothetical protein
VRASGQARAALRARLVAREVREHALEGLRAALLGREHQRRRADGQPLTRLAARNPPAPSAPAPLAHVVCPLELAAPHSTPLRGARGEAESDGQEDTPPAKHKYTRHRARG